MTDVADLPDGDPLAEAVVPESVKHSRVARLIAQVGVLAQSGGSAAVERLGLRWPDRSISAPDFFLLPDGAVSWDTTSYVVGVDGPKPLVAVEVVVDHGPDIADLHTRGVTTYLVYPTRGEVFRFSAEDRTIRLMADREPCPELGIAFARGIGAIGVVDRDGVMWNDPDEHLRHLASRAAEADTARAEADTARAEADALRARLEAAEARLRQLEPDPPQ